MADLKAVQDVIRRIDEELYRRRSMADKLNVGLKAFRFRALAVVAIENPLVFDHEAGEFLEFARKHFPKLPPKP